MNIEKIFYLIGCFALATYVLLAFFQLRKHKEILYSYSPNGLKKFEYSILREIAVRGFLIGISIPQICNASVYGVFGQWIIPPTSIGTRSIIIVGAIFYVFFIWENAVNYVVNEIDKRKKIPLQK